MKQDDPGVIVGGGSLQFGQEQRAVIQLALVGNGAFQFLIQH